MKIVFMTRSLEVGGAERQLATLACGLQRAGREVVVASLYPGGSLQKELEDAGVRVRILNKRSRWDICGFFINLVTFLQNESADILHGYLVVPNLLAVLYKPFSRGEKIVWGVRASDMDLSRYDWLARFAFTLSSLVSRFADLIIVNSRSGMEYHRKKKYPAKKMILVPNGIDTERFKPNHLERTKIRLQWGVKEGEKVIGLVARLDPMKDHRTFLRAAAILSHERNDVRFVCVGDGPQDYRDSLHAMSADLGLSSTLLWTGSRTDTCSIYSAFEIATSSSLSEGFPNVIGEAMACGIPCVVTDVGDSSAIVGNTGLIVPPGDPKSLARAWNRSLLNTRPFPDMDCRERIIQEYSVEQLVMRTERALESLTQKECLC